VLDDISLIVFRAPACRRHQLTARFRAGGYGAGNDFGNIEIRNTGSGPCRLAGSVGFAAYFADGRRDSNAVVEVHRDYASALLLPTRHWQSAEIREALADVIVSGEYRDDPAQPDALCRTQDEGHPLTLIVTIGQRVFRVQNYDAAGRNDGYGLMWVEGCHGQLSVSGIVRPKVKAPTASPHVVVGAKLPG
jgi:hypothetical protein